MLRALFRRFRKQIFWRIYLYSLALLLAVALGITAIVFLVGGKTPRQGAPVRRAELASSVLLPHLEDGPELREHLGTIRRSLGMDISLYDGQGRALATAGAPPPPPLFPGEFSTLESQSYFLRGAALYVAVPLDPLSPGGPYLIMGELAPSGLTRIISSVLLLFLFLALVSFPVSRTVARPLEKLTSCAHRLSQGELTARTDIEREDELGQLAAAVNDMASRLEKRIRREKELLGTISHEIRTPLSRIRVAIDLCEEEGDPARSVSRLRGIGGDLEELDGMVEDILLAAKLDLAIDNPAGQGMAAHSAPVSIADLASRSARIFSEKHPEHRLQLSIADEVPPLRGDPVFLRRTIDNILDNAARHSPPDQPIDLSISPEGDGIGVEIHDRGSGMGSKDLSRIFEPFYRGINSARTGERGAGLGLTLCKRTVEAHGGTIRASSRPGGGTTVSFSIPLDLAGARDLG